MTSANLHTSQSQQRLHEQRRQDQLNKLAHKTPQCSSAHVHRPPHGDACTGTCQKAAERQRKGEEQVTKRQRTSYLLANLGAIAFGAQKLLPTVQSVFRTRITMNSHKTAVTRVLNYVSLLMHSPRQDQNSPHTSSDIIYKSIEI